MPGVLLTLIAGIVRDPQDFRVFLVLWCGRMNFQFTKLAREFDMMATGNGLVPEEDNLVAKQRLPDLGDHNLVQRL